MDKDKEFMREYAEIANALTNWFMSQEITVGKAVGVMGYLIGVMAGEIAETEAGVIKRLDLVNLASISTALLAFDKKHGRG